MQSEHASDGKRTGLDDVLADYMQRVDRGERVDADELIAAHPGLADELRNYFSQAAAVELVAVAQTADFASEATPRGGLEIRCPSCHIPMEIAVDTALTDLTCSACGSHFSLVDQSKATRMAPSLTKMGRFELIERLGVGGFGSVWKARDKELDRTVAVKIPRQGAMTPEEQEKFFREARAAAQLRHPNIVSVHEVGRDGDSIYIVNDFIRGATLGDWLTGQQLTSREAAELCAKIADALHHAHENGVVHRDLKPANVMIDDYGQPHLMDFGLARREVGEVTVTIDGQVLGTPAFMSPEQAQGEGHNADRRSDVYSLGVILFQLLTGELPFRGNARMLIHQVINDPAPSPRKFNANVRKDLETIALKCLEKEPEKRYQNAQQLSADLRRFLSGEPIHARPAGRLERTWRWAKRRPAAAALLGLIAAVAVFGPLVAVQQTILRLHLDKVSAERELALAQLNEKHGELQDQLANNLFERAAVEYDAGRVPQAIAMLAGAYETATASNPLRLAFRSLMAGWATDAPQTLPHDDSVVAVAFSPDGRIAATGSLDKTVRFWDTKTGAPLGASLRHDDAIRALAFSPDGRWLLTGGDDATARLWDVANRESVGEAFRHGASVMAVAFSPDGNTIITAGSDRAARLWDVGTRKQRQSPLRHASAVSSVAFSPDGRIVATGCQGKTAHLWNVSTGAPIGEDMQHKDQIKVVAFSPNGTSLLTASFDDSPKLWDSQSGKLMRQLPRVGFAYSGTFSHEGRLVLVGDIVGRITIFDVQTGQIVGRIQQAGQILALALNSDDSAMLTGSSDATGRLLRFQTRKGVESVRHTKTLSHIAFSPDGSRVVTGGGDNVALLWDIKTGKPLGKAMQHQREMTAIAFSPSDNKVLTASGDKVVRMWDGETGEPVGEPLLCKGLVRAILFSDENEPILAATDQHSVLLLHGRSGRLLGELRHDHSVLMVAFSADGRIMATAGSDQRVHIWNVTSRTAIGQPLRHDSGILSLALSPDGKTLASGCNDQTARLWDVQTGQLIGELKDAGPVIYAIAFSPDGRTVLAGTERRGARLWDAQTAKPLASPMGHADWVTAVAFSPDGRTLLTGCNDGTIWVWDGPPPPLADDHSYITPWAKFRTGFILDDQRTLRRLSQADWLTAQKVLHGSEQPAIGSPSAEQHVAAADVAEESAYLDPPIEVLRSKLGQNLTVELEIARADVVRGTILISSVRDFQRNDCFTVTLPDSQLPLLEKLGIKYADELVGRRIRVSGQISDYAGRISMEVANVLTQVKIRTPDGEWLAAESAEAFPELLDPSIDKLRTFVQQQQTVTFRVQATGGRSRIYLNSKVNYRDPDCFTAVVEADQVAAFASLGLTDPLVQLMGKTVRVTGVIEQKLDYPSHVQIRITNLGSQLEITD